ncbi:MAG: hypothetical protein ACOCX7_00575 [Bacteroidota bacterium]
MKKAILKVSLLVVAGILFALPAGDIFAQNGMAELKERDYANFDKIRNAYYNIWKDQPQSDRKGYKQFKRWEYFWSRRVGPKGQFPSGDVIMKAFKQSEQIKIKADKIQSVEWRQLGPDMHPESQNGVRDQGIGRINAVRVHPQFSNELWAGAASGGVWRSTNRGGTWSVFPFTQFLSLGVSDIAISLSNPDVVYVATGDADGSAGSRNFYSVGVIKTVDGGENWSVTALEHTLGERKLIGKLAVHPQNSDIVYAATSSGVWKSTDGGDTWDLSSGGGFFIDMEMHPSNPDILYASTFSWSGNTSIYRTTDGGENWEEVQSLDGAVRIALAVTIDDPATVYALAANSATRGFHSFRVSRDKGETWQVVGDMNNTPNILGWYMGTGNDLQGQGQYDLALTASPKNSDMVFVGGINTWRSTNGGRDWEMVSHWFGGFGKPYVHADIHDLNYNFDGSVLYSGHDGGIDYSANNGNTWVDITQGMNITQFYRLSNSAKDNQVVYGGSQDNGTWRLRNGKWEHIYAGDGMECLVDYNDPDNIYVSMYNGKFYRSTNGGASFYQMVDEGVTGESGAWVTPFVIDPNNPSVLYAGYQNVWKSQNKGISWNTISDLGLTSTMEAIAVAPSDSRYIYAASHSTLYYTTNGGSDWSTLSTGSAEISYIAVDPKNPERIWISKYGFDEDEKVFMYDGEELKNISGNLPNVPINSIVHQKDSPDRLYIGTDIGVFTSDYNSAIWEPHGSGLPNVIVYELEIHYPTKTLRAATYGRGMWETDLNECDLQPIEISINEQPKICQGDTLRLTAIGSWGNFEWSNGQTGPTIGITEQGSYSVKAVDPATGCTTRSEVINVDVLYVPEVSIDIRGDNPFCEGSEITLRANFGFTEYEWSNGMTGRSIDVTDPGEYSVRVLTRDGCEAYSDIVTLSVLPAPAKPEIYRNGNTLMASTAKTAARRCRISMI